jgi:transposase InsO family protein
LILESIDLYSSYNIKIKELLKMFELSKSCYYTMKKRMRENEISTVCKPTILKKAVHAITDAEKQKIINYALKNTQYFHRELSYRMIDENIVFVSPSTCYRVLKEYGLIREYKRNSRYSWQHKYQNYANMPDELWQTDITYIRYNKRDWYLLIFIDVYSRYVVFNSLLTSMDSKTVTEIFENYINKNLNTLKRKPRLQSDNGSCYIGYEFQSLISKYKFKHTTIHPGCPTENIIVERFNRTAKELLYELDEPESFEQLESQIKKVCDYYNNNRYHKSLNYVTPYTFYRGEPEKIFEERNKKIALAKIRRKKFNMLN